LFTNELFKEERFPQNLEKNYSRTLKEGTNHKKDPRYGVLRAWVMGILFLAPFYEEINPYYI
tara:strand:- start:6448 stop:6633 length:186 start_codon:yes stop_codon:yes gene_type:complete